MSKMDKKIIHKYLSGNASQDEIADLERWMDESNKNKTLVKELKWIWENSEKIKDKALEEYNPDVEAALKNLHEKIEDDGKIKQISFNTKWPWIGLAASFLLILFIWQSGLVQDNQFHYITKAGESKEILLPDSSKVWLAENSELTFSNVDQYRKTTLVGEGYFEISKNKERPFIIQGQRTGITVLGTKFNFKSKTDELEEEVYVSEGKVNFYNLKSKNQAVMLTKGERGIFNIENNRLTEDTLSNPNISAWATGILRFEDTQLSEAIKDIEKYYDISIQVENDQLLDCTLTSNFKNEELDLILETLGLIFQTEVIKKDRSNYLLKKGGCK